ncbi:hypothetical protein L6V77_12675 [Myxococcota bacterium]|nr:hypothetical protein [Myxococcota bacterium]
MANRSLKTGPGRTAMVAFTALTVSVTSARAAESCSLRRTVARETPTALELELTFREAAAVTFASLAPTSDPAQLLVVVPCAETRPRPVSLGAPVITTARLRPSTAPAAGTTLEVHLRTPYTAEQRARVRIEVRDSTLTLAIPRSAPPVAVAPAPLPPTIAPVAPRPAPPPSSPAPGSAPAKETFVEGELAEIGAATLPPWENRAGVSIGLERVGEVYYGAATPRVSYADTVADRPLSLAFGVPLRFEILDARPNERYAHAGRLRTEDWDQPGDYARVIERIRYGGKEKRLYVNVDSSSTTTIGHGPLMRRYNPHLDFNRSRVSAEVDAFDDFGGGELYVNDVVEPHLAGGILFVKPLSLIDPRDDFLRSVSLGFTFLVDVDAPARMELDLQDRDDDGRRESEWAINQDSFEPQALEVPVLAWGADIEAKFIDERILDWKAYFDYSALSTALPAEGGIETSPRRVALEDVYAAGFTFGHLLRMNFGQGDDPVQAVRLRAEYRNHAPNYLPGYFDVLYEVQRARYGGGSGDTGEALANGTKSQRVLGRDPDGARVHGGYFEASWRYSHYVALAIGVEANNTTPDDNVLLHAEIPRLGDWQFRATYHRRQADSLLGAFTPTLGRADYLTAALRYAVHDFVHVRADLGTPFGIGPDSLYRSKLQANFGVDFGVDY